MEVDEVEQKWWSRRRRRRTTMRRGRSRRMRRKRMKKRLGRGSEDRGAAEMRGQKVEENEEE